ncbi:MAG: DUF2798 domain-containing protein [Idiomarina sp.]|nr:DUF2798 domain-containing protein [Idiomarina sp.]
MKWIFPILMSLYMSFLMTGLITWINTGVDGDFISRWWRAFYIAWPIAFVLVYLGAQPIRQFAEKLAEKKPPKLD